MNDPLSNVRKRYSFQFSFNLIFKFLWSITEVTTYPFRFKKKLNNLEFQTLKRIQSKGNSIFGQSENIAFSNLIDHVPFEVEFLTRFQNQNGRIYKTTYVAHGPR